MRLSADDPRRIRQHFGMNQAQFWGILGVEQSTGSRYECGREVPRPMRQLIQHYFLRRPLPRIEPLAGPARRFEKRGRRLPK